jgi:hypothetical protein
MTDHMDDDDFLIGGPPTRLNEHAVERAQTDHGPGLVQYRGCDLCGSIAWVSTDTTAEPGIVVVTRFAPHPTEYGRQCRRCLEAGWSV